MEELPTALGYLHATNSNKVYPMIFILIHVMLLKSNCASREHGITHSKPNPTKNSQQSSERILGLFVRMCKRTLTTSLKSTSTC